MLLNKYIEQEEFGHPIDVLKQKEKFLVGYQNILVKVLIRNINPSDILSINGEGQYLYNHPVPRIPGFEAIGEVISSKDPGFAIDDRVLIMTAGTWQTFMDVSSQFLLKLPKYIKDELAVQVYINGLTAWIILTELINANSSHRIIINAGNSSISRLFIQLSKYFNYKIIIVTSSENYQQLRSYGADFVISSHYSLKEQMIKYNIPTPNVALDAVGGHEGAKLLETVTKRGKFIIYGCLSRQNYPVAISNLFKDKQIIPKRFFLKEWENRVEVLFRNAKLYQLLDCLSQQRLSLPIYKKFHMKDFKKALQEYELKNYKNKKGKILLSSYDYV